MKLVIQRVKSAKVTCSGNTVGQIDKGLFILLGVGQQDKEEDVERVTEAARAVRDSRSRPGRRPAPSAPLVARARPGLRRLERAALGGHLPDPAGDGDRVGADRADSQGEAGCGCTRACGCAEVET